MQFGAGDETQTRGLFLGKEALYQLSYTRLTGEDYSYFDPMNQVYICPVLGIVCDSKKQ